jgi:hypothetical protein
MLSAPLTHTKDGPDFPKHESAALHEAYQLFSTVSGPEEQQPSILKLCFIFLNLAKVDFDAASRFLARLASQVAWNQNIRTVIDGLYQFIIPHDLLPEDIKSKATAGLTASIESKKFDSALLTNENEISWCMLYDVKPQGRDSRNAKLRLQANLFTLSDSEVFTQMTAQGQSDLSSWVTMLEDAAWDEVVSSFSACLSSLLASSADQVYPGHADASQCCVFATRLHTCAALGAASFDISLTVSADLPPSL